MLIIYVNVQCSWISDDIVLDGFKILHTVQVEVGGLVFAHVVRSGCGNIGFEQGSVCPDARSMVSASNGSWGAWVAVTILIREFVLSASWIVASSSISSRSLVGRTRLACSLWSSDLQEWVAASLDSLLAAISKVDGSRSSWAYALTCCVSCLLLEWTSLLNWCVLASKIGLSISW